MDIQSRFTLWKEKAVDDPDLIAELSAVTVFTLANLNFEAVSALCADPDYKTRVTFLANTKEPTLRLKLSSGVDSLKQSKVFIDRYRSCCNS